MRRIAVLLLAALVPGCFLFETFRCKEPQSYLADNIEEAKLNRIVVLPFLNPTEYPDAGPRVTDAFCTELRKLGTFEVCAIDETKLMAMIHRDGVIEPREFDMRELDLVTRATGADGVIVGSVTHYMPYQPMVFGLRVRLLHANDGKLLWSVEDIYDSSLQEVVNLSKKYSQKVEKLTGYFEGWHGREKPLTSMRYFTQFVCYEIIRTLKTKK